MVVVSQRWCVRSLVFVGFCGFWRLADYFISVTEFLLRYIPGSTVYHFEALFPNITHWHLLLGGLLKELKSPRAGFNIFKGSFRDPACQISTKS